MAFFWSSMWDLWDDLICVFELRLNIGADGDSVMSVRSIVK